MNWIDNADSYICPVCGEEVSNPANLNFTCPKCGFVAEKDKSIVSKVMNEKRLIDANVLKRDLNKLPIMSNWGEVFVPTLIDKQPTVYPETLPIVRELRERLERVTAERDEARRDCAVAERNHAECLAQLAKARAQLKSAVADMEALMWHSGDGCNICKHCVEVHREPYVRLDCDLGSGCECKPEWRGSDGDHP